MLNHWHSPVKQLTVKAAVSNWAEWKSNNDKTILETAVQNNMQKMILLVEDEAAIAEPLQYALKRENWQVIWHTTATEALEALRRQHFDFIILDVGLPDMDGFELCRKIRQHWQTPLLFLTARNDEIERIIGIEIGADDYCGKPFSPREIISRIKAIWRRMQLSAETGQYPNVAIHSQSLEKTATIIEFAHWHADLNRYQIKYYGQLLQLTRYESGLLIYLLKHPEQVFSRMQLMQQVWEHPDHSLERTVDTHIKSLRQKLKLLSDDDPIITHRGLGYSLKR